MSKKAQRSILSHVTALSGAALLVALAACSGDVASPAARTPQVRTPSLLPGNGRLISNSVKYRDTSAPHATGRSGSARLEGVALLGANGVTTLTISSSSLLGTRPSGDIVKAQIKVFDAGGELLFVENHNKLSGSTQTFLLSGVPAGMRVQVQANVRGIDRSRTDVVTITEVVKLAPALQVDVQLPPTVVIGQPVVVTGTVTETNGDTGTRATCELWVDGKLVDQAEGIWVDAGDAVTCAFTWTPDGPGQHTVEVRVDGGGGAGQNPAIVTDGGNVNVTASVVTGYAAQAEDRSVDNTTVFDYTWWRPDGSHKEYSNTETFTERTQTVNVQGTLDRAVQFPVAAMGLTLTSGGVTWEDEAWSALLATLDGQGRQCVTQDLAAHGAMFFICNGLLGGASWGYQRYAGRVTYHSYGYARLFDVRESVDSYYTWNDSFNTSETPARIRDLGTALSLGLTFTDAVGTVTFSPVIPLSPFSNALTDTPRTCLDSSPYYLDGGTLTECHTARTSEYGMRGSITG